MLLVTYPAPHPLGSSLQVWHLDRGRVAKVQGRIQDHCQSSFIPRVGSGQRPELSKLFSTLIDLRQGSTLLILMVDTVS